MTQPVSNEALQFQSKAKEIKRQKDLEMNRLKTVKMAVQKKETELQEAKNVEKAVEDKIAELTGQEQQLKTDIENIARQMKTK